MLPAPRSTSSNLADKDMPLVFMISSAVPDVQAVCAVECEVTSPVRAMSNSSLELWYYSKKEVIRLQYNLMRWYALTVGMLFQEAG